MKKFMKYEIKGTYKFIFGILLTIILASSMIQYNIFNEVKNFGNNQIAPNSFLWFMFIISVFVIFGAFITAFFYIISSFRKELYEDRGYLTFTLPLTGNQILGSKLLVAVMWNIVIGALAFLYNLLLGTILFKGELRVILEEFIKIADISLISSVFISIISSMSTLILIYFAISLSKVSIRNKKIGGMWFIIFLILSGLISFLITRIGIAIPYFLDLNTFKITSLDALNSIKDSGMMEFSIEMGTPPMLGGVHPGHINIAEFISQILFALALFMATGYLIEEKIEL